MCERSRFHLAAALLLAIAPGAVAEIADPTRPPVNPAAVASAAVEPEAATLTLSMTRVSAGRRQAVINGELVDEGDLIGSARIMAIEHGRVRMRRGEREWTLTIHNAEIKRRSTAGQ